MFVEGLYETVQQQWVAREPLDRFDQQTLQRLVVVAVQPQREEPRKYLLPERERETELLSIMLSFIIQRVMTQFRRRG